MKIYGTGGPHTQLLATLYEKLLFQKLNPVIEENDLIPFRQIDFIVKY